MPTATNPLRKATAHQRCGFIVPRPAHDNTATKATAITIRTLKNCQTLTSVAIVAT